MDDRDRAIVAAAEERDRAWLLPAVRNDAPAGYLAAYDRHDLLRIVREQAAEAERYREALADIAMNGNPSTARDIARVVLGGKPDTAASDRADADAAAEAEFLKPIGGGL